MLFRTRDFALFILTVAFLVVAIFATARGNIIKGGQNASVISFDNSEQEVSYEAVLPAAEPDGRTSRLADLKAKIAKLMDSEPEIFLPPEVEEEVVPVTEVEVTLVTSVNLCSNYAVSNPSWSPTNLVFEVVEGARLVYRESLTSNVSNPVTGSTTPFARDVVLQLPLRSFPLSVKSCIETDVIGIALDGSLIRNNENKVYGIFGSDTQVGYALDGFPIYGLSKDTKTDECGGSTISGEYRYYLSSEREGILGCFSGIPERL